MSVPQGTDTAVVKAGAERGSEEYQHGSLTRGRLVPGEPKRCRVHPTTQQVSIRPNRPVTVDSPTSCRFNLMAGFRFAMFATRRGPRMGFGNLVACRVVAAPDG